MSTLSKPFVHRETFDPNNGDHLRSFDIFLKTGNWGDIQFFTELPYTDVPMTVLMKFAMAYRLTPRETEVERTERLRNIPGLIRMQAFPTETLEEVRQRKFTERKTRTAKFKADLKAHAAA